MKEIVYKGFILFFLLVVGETNKVSGQSAGEEEVISPYIEFKYIKNTEGNKILEAKLFHATDLGLDPIEGLAVEFYTNNIDEPVLLGEAITDSRGTARYFIPEGTELPLDEDGYWWFYALFEGSEGYEMTMEEISLMDVNLEMSLEEEGEDKKIILEAYTMEEGQKTPVSDEDIFIYVPRMFSLLPVAEGYFIDGVAEVEFPGDVPGDKEGRLTVIGRFNDHWQFATVEQRADTEWGVPSSHEVAETHRALWTQIAPTWMIITLSIMLAGVWGHYLFAVVSIIRLKRIGKESD